MAVKMGKLSRSFMRHSIRLLDMEYKPAELADELGATKEQIIRMIAAGAPARKDAKGHYWIHGLSFAQWLNDAAPKKDNDRHVFQDDEAYCMTCRRVVVFIPSRKTGRVIYGTCPDGHKVSRFTRKEAK